MHEMGHPARRALLVRPALHILAPASIGGRSSPQDASMVRPETQNSTSYVSSSDRMEDTGDIAYMVARQRSGHWRRVKPSFISYPCPDTMTINPFGPAPTESVGLRSGVEEGFWNGLLKSNHASAGCCSLFSQRQVSISSARSIRL